MANFALRRAAKYADGMAKLNALGEFLRREPVDWIVYTGDSVNMGLAREFLVAAPVFGAVLGMARRGAMAVPGNHDLYTRGSVGAFRKWMGGLPGLRETERPAARAGADWGWPTVRFFDERTVAIGLNTACPHWAFWNSSGRLAREELDALEHLLDDPDVEGRERVLLVTHYPLDEAGFFRGMRGSGEIARVLAGRRNLAILHGHNHVNYVRRLPGTDVPLYCCGSLSKAGAESFWLYEPMGPDLNPRRALWRNARWVLE